MLKEKEVPDAADTKRLGKTFQEDRILDLYKKLDEAGLPIIPYNASLDELNRLVEHIAARYAYLQDSFGMLKAEERKRMRAHQRAFSKAYLSAEERVAGATQAVLKMVADATPEVVEAADRLDEIRNQIDLLDNRLRAFGILDQDARKLLSSAIEALNQRIS